MKDEVLRYLEGLAVFLVFIFIGCEDPTNHEMESETIWHTETLGTTYFLGYGTAIAIDNEDRPHIAHKNEDSLEYYFQNAEGWHKETISLPEILYIDLEIDNTGVVHFCGTIEDAYEVGMGVYYIQWDGLNWTYQELEYSDPVGMYTSLAIDSNNYPHICYVDNSKYLRYAHFSGSTWQFETISSAGYCAHCSIVLDSNDLPYISVYDPVDNDFFVVYSTGTEWSIRSVADEGDVGKYNSIALDSNNIIHLSYFDQTNFDLLYARQHALVDSYFLVEPVDDTIGYAGEYNSIALNSEGYPRISYYDWSSGALQCALWDGHTWDVSTVDSDGNVGRFSSIALDSNGAPHIAYVDMTNDTIKYAKYITN